MEGQESGYNWSSKETILGRHDLPPNYSLVKLGSIRHGRRVGS